MSRLRTTLIKINLLSAVSWCFKTVVWLLTAQCEVIAKAEPIKRTLTLMLGFTLSNKRISLNIIFSESEFILFELKPYVVDSGTVTQW